MLVRTSSKITPDFAQLTLGEACFYLLETENRLALFDCGSSVLLPLLIKRLDQFGLSAEQLTDLFITQPSPERIGGLPYLRKINPSIKVYSTSGIQKLLSDSSFTEQLFSADQELSEVIPVESQEQTLAPDEYRQLLNIDRVLPDTETVSLGDDTNARCFSSPGCTAVSASYFIIPHNFIIACQGFGYFKGRDLAAPGADDNLKDSIDSIHRFNDIEVDAVCLPYSGTLTGDLARKHLHNIVQNTEDLIEECCKAFSTGLPEEEIFEAVKSSFYSSDTQDALFLYKLNQSLEKIWEQIRTYPTEEATEENESTS